MNTKFLTVALVLATLAACHGKDPQADAARESERTAALWSYDKEAVKGGGTQLSASIYSRDPVDTGDGAQPVRLIFRDHPAWGRSSYLVLAGGDFDKACYGHCKVMVSVDEQAPKAMAANRPARSAAARSTTRCTSERRPATSRACAWETTSTCRW